MPKRAVQALSRDKFRVVRRAPSEQYCNNSIIDSGGCGMMGVEVLLRRMEKNRSASRKVFQSPPVYGPPDRKKLSCQFSS
jgi:hypothetical protein